MSETYVRKRERKMTVYGYARVSTNKQELEQQIDKLEKAGAVTIFSEKYTGRKKDGRKELAKLLESVQAGDEVVVTKIDRLARSIMDLKSIIADITEKGASIHFLDNNLIFKSESNDAMQNLMLNMLASFAEFERDLIVSRTQDGKEYAKKANKNYREGRPSRKITPAYQHAYELLKQGISYKEVSRKTNISESTLHRIRRQIEEA